LKWKTNVITRPPKDSEKLHENFTLITISDINQIYVENYDSQHVRSELTSIYHYYIHGSKGNVQKEVKEIEDSDSDSEYEPMIEITVDGKSLRDEGDDLESSYLQLGKNPFTFNFTISAKGSDTIQSSQGSQNRVFSKVQGIIYYYPYTNGQETLPIPGSIDEEEVSLAQRVPGLECFWNGRLLMNEKIPSLPFMKGKKTHDVPDHCYKRIKGMLFFDSSFEVSANKMYLCKQTPLCQAMLNFDDRTLAAKYKKWIKDSHTKYDEEVTFLF
jgi:structural maintenance of chromosomes flexible hinge domain-containing protein 1